jgi:hypothetical protein
MHVVSSNPGVRRSPCIGDLHCIDDLERFEAPADPDALAVELVCRGIDATDVVAIGMSAGAGRRCVLLVKLRHPFQSQPQEAAMQVHAGPTVSQMPAMIIDSIVVRGSIIDLNIALNERGVRPVDIITITPLAAEHLAIGEHRSGFTVIYRVPNPRERT